MRPRTLAREAALKALYQLDLRPELGLDGVAFVFEELPTDDARAFARELVRGTRAHLAEIDRELEQVTHNWRIERMAAIDRNVLRMGAYELLHLGPSVPPAVAINEAVTIVKKYSTKDSGGFVNGILDKVHHRHQAVAVPGSLPLDATPPAPAPDEDPSQP